MVTESFNTLLEVSAEYESAAVFQRFEVGQIGKVLQEQLRFFLLLPSIFQDRRVSSLCYKISPEIKTELL